MKALLAPLGWLYGFVITQRNALYDRGIFRAASLGARTISIGNITAGGTGKTPIVAAVAAILAHADEKVCVLTRGYGRDRARGSIIVSDGQRVLVNAAVGGDEPVVLGRRLLGIAAVIANPDRRSAAKLAKKRFGSTAFVLDDGFQHRAVARDLDIVCIDATAPFGGGMIPAGTLREPARNLRRAAVVVVTRADLVDDVDKVARQIRTYAPESQLFVSENRVSNIVSLNDFSFDYASRQIGGCIDWSRLFSGKVPSDRANRLRIGAFCGLGNAGGFFAQIRRILEIDATASGLNIVFTKAFRDHHRYQQSDIDGLEKEAGRSHVDAFVTTAKDAVKLNSLNFRIPCFVVEIEPIISDMDGFRRLILGSD